MKFWSVQSIDILDYIREHGVLQGVSEFSKEMDMDTAYSYMKSKYVEYTNYSFKEGEELVWLWTKKPQIVKDEDGYVYDKDHVLLEIEIDRNLVLLSDYDIWHFVLNDFAIEEYSESEEEIEYSEEEKIKSWEKVFNLKYCHEFHEKENNNNFVMTLQGVTSSILKDNIKVLSIIPKEYTFTI